MVESALSQFLAAEPDFFGGPKVNEFERACEAYFGVKHAITVNSWTSGLIAAVGAIGIEPGDEVIVSPWTMCASATAILHWNAIPVFADIEEQTFCLHPGSVEACITPQTRAIMAIDIFGQSADMKALRAIADKYNLKIISDTAQAPGARYGASFAGTLADVGGYSLNYHKHINTGEVSVTMTFMPSACADPQPLKQSSVTVWTICQTCWFRLGDRVCHRYRTTQETEALAVRSTLLQPYEGLGLPGLQPRAS